MDVADSIEDYEGVALSRFEALTTLHVWTRNSHYRLIVLDKSEVMVQGGAAFPAPTRARHRDPDLTGRRDRTRAAAAGRPLVGLAAI